MERRCAAFFFCVLRLLFFFNSEQGEGEREGRFFFLLARLLLFLFRSPLFPSRDPRALFFFSSLTESHRSKGKKNFAFSSAPLSPTMAGGGAHEVSILETPIMMLAGVMAFFLVVTGLFEFVSC